MPYDDDDRQRGLMNMLKNLQYAKSGPYQTTLEPDQQSQFYQWARGTGAPITPDYDMPGFWAGGGRAADIASGHYPDTFKTPMHDTFSNESKYALPTAASWRGPKHDQYAPPGVPTAEQEALQQPKIDPVMLMGIGAGPLVGSAMGLGGASADLGMAGYSGLKQMLQGLGMGSLGASLGQGQKMNDLAMLPGLNVAKAIDEIPAASAMLSKAHSFVRANILETLARGGFITGKESPSEMLDIADEVFWGDKPLPQSTLMLPDYQMSASEKLTDLIHSLTGDETLLNVKSPYPGASVTRPLGMAALIEDMKQQGSKLYGRATSPMASQPR
jgi:hypothetical protein